MVKNKKSNFRCLNKIYLACKIEIIYLIKNKKLSLKLLAESLLPSVGMLAQVNLAFPIKKAVTVTSLMAGFLSFIYLFLYPLCPEQPLQRAGQQIFVEEIHKL